MMKTELTIKLTALALATALTTLSTAAFAQKSSGGGGSGDGVIAIDQAKALAGNVTPGDAGGFPVTISQPGHYRLTSNLVMSDMSMLAIVVAAPNVTIDLNGFAIQGPNVCNFTNKTCTGGGMGGQAIQGNQPNLTVHGGTVEGFGGVAINTTFGGTFTDLMLRHNFFGIQSGGATMVERVQAEVNYVGISLVNDYGIVRNSRFTRNLNNGIQMSGGLVQGVVAYNNGGRGLSVGGSLPVAGYRESVFVNNAGGDVYNGMSLGDNACTGKVAC